MDFIRRQAFLLICGVVAAGGIGLMVTGVRGMPAVMEEMRKAEQVYRNVSGLQPVSIEKIEKVRERIDAVQEDHDKIVERAGQLYGYARLVDAALPEGDSIACIEFRNRYAAAMEDLMKLLSHGGPPTMLDVKLMEDKIAEERAKAAEFGMSGGGPTIHTGSPQTPAGVLTAAGVQQTPVARASVLAAQRIQLYAKHYNETRGDEAASLDFFGAMRGTGALDPPDLFDVWHAQYNYWIQKDVVNAIAALNKSAADALRQAGEHAWVGNLPVKELISVRVSQSHIRAEDEAFFGPKPGGTGAALPPATAATVFTENASTASYEVVQFTIKAIMDQREIPKLIDLLSKDKFNTLLRVSYEAVAPNRTLVGKIYGDGPVVNVIIDFETVLLGPVFRRWIPESVREHYGITCRPVDECKAAQDG
jgi:hypothetical protein